MKLSEFNFNTVPAPYHMAVRKVGTSKWYEEEFMGDTLKSLPPEFAGMEIKETRMYFDTFVIEVE